MKFMTAKVFFALFLAVLIPCSTLGLDHKARQYTEQTPLVYEDAWDLWPYVFLNEKGEPEGFNVDILKAILGELGIPYIIKLKPSRETLKDLKEGRSDLRLGMEAPFNSGNAFYGRQVVQLFTHSVISVKDKPLEVKGIDDLGRHRVIMHDGSFSHHLMVYKGWGDNCIPMNDMMEAVQDVSSEGEGYIVWNTMSLKWLMTKFKPANLQLTPLDIPHGKYKFMANDTVLLHQLDSVYAALYLTDRLEPILNKWFYPEKSDSGIPEWVWYVIAIVTALTLLLLYYIMVFRIRAYRIVRQTTARNKHLSFLLRISHLMVWLYDVQNKSFIWMMPDGEIDTMQLTPRQFWENFDVDDVTKMGYALAEMENDVNATHSLEMRDNTPGRNRVYVVTLSVFRCTKRGRPSLIIGLMNDQTEELLAQRKTKDNMLRYQSIFSTSMIDMVYFDANGIVRELNQKACDTFHLSYEQALDEVTTFNNLDGTNASDIDCMTVSRSTHFVKTGSQERNSLFRNIPHDIYYEWQMVPLYDATNRFLGFFGSGRDVTEFVNSYYRQKENNARLLTTTSEITDYVSNINYALHVGGIRLVSYSPTSHLLTIYKGLNEVQLTLTQTHCLSLVDERSKRKATHLLNSMDMFGDDTIDADIITTLRIPGGKTLVVQFNFVPLRNQHGLIDSYTGLCRDISEQFATELQLERETAKAQEIENVKNVFLHNMTHEIKAPVSTVVEFANLFVQANDPIEEERYISEIKSNTGYLLKLVNDTLLLSRLDAHMVEIRTSLVDFSETFGAHCQMGMAKSWHDGVKYVVENPYEHLVVDIDNNNLGHVISQIAENAAQATTQGMVRTRYDYIGDKLLITIDDTGSGMDSEQLQHVFDRFSRQASPNYKGTGLGMAICQELVQQMNGSIYFNSAVGKGTTVWIVIPCKATTIVKRLNIDNGMTTI